MKLGILVNTDKHLDDIAGITEAAVSKGHEVILFAMDDGTKLLENPSYTELCKLQGVTMSFCDHSAQKISVKTEGIAEEIIRGSQYNNAAMDHDSDKVIVL
ncbi:MAG: DsrE family protein [Nitrospirota bacterium]|nr:DsrE family protein [Nitrospirota bacterium]